MNIGDTNLALAKNGVDCFSDDAAHTCDSADTTNSRTACDHWQAIWLDAGANITAITLIAGQECYGLDAMGAVAAPMFIPVKFTGITVTGTCFCVRKQLV